MSKYIYISFYNDQKVHITNDMICYPYNNRIPNKRIKINNDKQELIDILVENISEIKTISIQPSYCDDNIFGGITEFVLYKECKLESLEFNLQDIYYNYYFEIPKMRDLIENSNIKSIKIYTSIFTCDMNTRNKIEYQIKQIRDINVAWYWI